MWKIEFLLFIPQIGKKYSINEKATSAKYSFPAEIKRHLEKEKGKLSKSRVGRILLVAGGGQFAVFRSLAPNTQNNLADWGNVLLLVSNLGKVFI